MKDTVTVVLWLPQRRGLAMQRRDDQAPTDKFGLSFFGGHLQPGDTLEQGIRRRIGIETSLPETLTVEYCTTGERPSSVDPTVTIRMNVFEATIPDANFEVHEGSGVEVHDPAVLLDRADLTPASRFVVRSLMAMDRWV